jgi:hypothetical protein
MEFLQSFVFTVFSSNSVILHRFFGQQFCQKFGQQAEAAEQNLNQKFIQCEPKSRMQTLWTGKAQGRPMARREEMMLLGGG